MKKEIFRPRGQPPLPQLAASVYAALPAPAGPAALIMCDPFPAEEAATSTIFRCKFPGCLRSYGSTDAARKHARKTHPDWLKLADAAAAKRVRGGPSTKSSFYCAREEAPLLPPSSAMPNGGLLRLDSALERLDGEGACGGEGEAAWGAISGGADAASAADPPAGSLAATAAFGDAAAPPSSAPGLPSSLPSLFSLGDGVGWGAGAPAWAWPEPLPPLLGGVGNDSPGGWDALPADRVADSLSLPVSPAPADSSAITDAASAALAVSAASATASLLGALQGSLLLDGTRQPPPLLWSLLAAGAARTFASEQAPPSPLSSSLPHSAPSCSPILAPPPLPFPRAGRPRPRLRGARRPCRRKPLPDASMTGPRPVPNTSNAPPLTRPSGAQGSRRRRPGASGGAL